MITWFYKAFLKPKEAKNMTVSLNKRTEEIARQANKRFQIQTWYFFKDKECIRIEYCTESYADSLGIRLFNDGKIDNWSLTPPDSIVEKGVKLNVSESTREPEIIDAEVIPEKSYKPEPIVFPPPKIDEKNPNCMVFEKIPSWKQSQALREMFPNSKENFYEVTIGGCGWDY